MRGELLASCVLPTLRVGSTPLARGTRSALISKLLLDRFNPACAGNSALTAASSLFSSVQPRLRGELQKRTYTSRHIPGSTPLARGTHRHQNNESPIDRFNPACAGNSIQKSRPAQSIGGSTPLARGTLRAGSGFMSRLRFNPACAGNSCTIKMFLEIVSVQPRLRGELVHILLILEIKQRFNPACAGNSSSFSRFAGT